MAKKSVIDKLRFVLYPIGVAYGTVVRFRHFLYDKKYIKSATFNFPIICVGNLAMGGTGKSPMVEYLIRLLEPKYKIATLSRGYKRKTKGFTLANNQSTAIEIGDEPMQFHQKFPNVVVAVGEERAEAIPQLLYAHPEVNLIILDDALQHRMVNAGFNILLTAHDDLYADDFLLPAGNLRDVVARADVADVIIVTKCPDDLDEKSAKEIVEKLNPKKNQPVLFAEIIYTPPVHLFSKEKGDLNSDTEILVLTGVAQPEPLLKLLRKLVSSYELIRFNDHHIFTSLDLKEIKKAFGEPNQKNKIILTTEKDGVRLEKFKNELSEYPIYTIPIEHRFLFDGKEKFDKLVENFMVDFKR